MTKAPSPAQAVYRAKLVSKSAKKETDPKKFVTKLRRLSVYAGALLAAGASSYYVSKTVGIEGLRRHAHDLQAYLPTKNSVNTAFSTLLSKIGGKKKSANLVPRKQPMSTSAKYGNAIPKSNVGHHSYAPLSGYAWQA